MKLPQIAKTSQSIEVSGDIQQTEDLFVVVKNHRQACIRRYLRKIRKEKQKQRRKLQEKWMEEAERDRNNLLNEHMLKEQQLWEVLIQDQKCEYNSETQQSGVEKMSKMEQAVQFVQQLPNWPKKNLFANQFSCFVYSS